MSTDNEWVKWGQQDPYFAVITDPKYRVGQLTDTALSEFFDSGRWHVQYLLNACRQHVDAAFAPKRALDFGCGVGRVALPLAELVEHVVGADVAPAMLAEAARNAAARGQQNLEWLLSDDALSSVHGRFDLVHSCITFQHIDIPRGRALFHKLIGLLAEGGVAAIQLTYGKTRYAEQFGQPPAPVAPPPPPKGLNALLAARPPRGDPEMQMNAYSLSELAFLMQSSGVKNFHAEFTDHGGELGVFLFFARPRSEPLPE